MKREKVDSSWAKAKVLTKKRARRMPIRKRLYLFLSLAVLLAGIQVLIRCLGGQSLLDRLVNFEEMAGHAFAARTSYWLAALRAFLDHPWIGSGLNTLQQTIFPHLVHGTFTRFPHNIFFQLMAEIGLPGAVLFTGLPYRSLDL